MEVGIVSQVPPEPARVSDILDVPAWLDASLAPHVRAAGLRPTERAAIDGVAWVEYSRSDRAGRLVLSVFHLSRERTITAEVWRPDRLRDAMREGGRREVAEQRRTWRYTATTGPTELGRAVAATIAGWFS
jgi:hypothetical protein